ncbi:TIR domain-containing protein, partial [Exiguobacterium artemiae]|uniref:TIR domain-containing protein n=1 Tax=Exiguobacterium artemiae TaxID=340145 RepID=UPI00136370A7
KKISLLERQKNEVNAIEYDDDRSSKVQIFRSRTKQILKRIFPDSDEYISMLEEISFISILHQLDIHHDPSEDYAFFQDGIKNTETLLNSAISNVQLEKELSEEENKPNVTPQKMILIDKTKVFIVHGHDDGLKHEVALFLKHLGIEPIILHEQLDRGQTIFQKFNSHANVGFAIVLYTPCDIGRPAKLNEKGEQYQEKYRARQNVIFEHGFFAAKLGLENAIALKKGDVEIPNDLAGVIYKEYDMAGSWKYQIARELDESGYEIDYKSIR